MQNKRPLIYLTPISMSGRLVVAIAVFSTLCVFLVGTFSDVSVGDEVYQFRFAKLWYENGKRPVFDPLIETTNGCPYYFDSDPLWALGLVGLWNISGEVSRPIMQAYHSLFFGGIIVMAYLCGKHLYGRPVGFYSALLASSTPFLLAYSVFIYLDIPTIFFILLGTILLHEKKYFWAGFAAGLAFLVKRNTWLFIPVLAVYLVTKKEAPLRSALQFAIPATLLTLPELIYHQRIWGDLFFPPTCAGPSPVSSAWTWTPSNIFYNPLAVVEYLGIILLGSLCAYLLWRKRKKHDWFLLVPIVSYIAEWTIIVPNQIAVRYFAPIFGFLFILGGLGIVALLKKSSLPRGILQATFLIAFLIQVGTTLVSVYANRLISEETREAFAFIEENAPPDSRVMYPEYVLSLETNRPMVWIRIRELEDLFWGSNEKQSQSIFQRYAISYILIKKTRVYDDTDVHHRLGYPRSFLFRLEQYQWIIPVFENEEMLILKVKLQK